MVGTEKYICDNVENCENSQCQHYGPHLYRGSCDDLLQGYCVKFSACVKCETPKIMDIDELFKDIEI